MPWCRPLSAVQHTGQAAQPLTTIPLTRSSTIRQIDLPFEISRLRQLGSDFEHRCLAPPRPADGPTVPMPPSSAPRPARRR
ncbi:hypothetical protein EV284_0416 [Streptomyces sp. BK022]|nr:hypothetical protein EV284_0416 [Streptomyces sp. BK022]